MRIIEVLKYVDEYTSCGSNDVSADLDITLGDAAVRLNKLYKSGLIRRLNGIYPYKYVITKFGKNYIKYKTENPGKRLQWHGLIPQQ